MKKKNQPHFLDETVKRAKLEKAQKEARQIYNYNNWQENHEKMVNRELRKLSRKNSNVFKAILIALLLALIIEIIYILTINDPKTIMAAIEGIKKNLNEIKNIIIELTIPK